LDEVIRSSLVTRLDIRTSFVSHLDIIFLQFLTKYTAQRHHYTCFLNICECCFVMVDFRLSIQTGKFKTWHTDCSHAIIMHAIVKLASTKQIMCN